MRRGCGVAGRLHISLASEYGSEKFYVFGRLRSWFGLQKGSARLGLLPGAYGYSPWLVSVCRLMNFPGKRGLARRIVGRSMVLSLRSRMRLKRG